MLGVTFTSRAALDADSQQRMERKDLKREKGARKAEVGKEHLGTGDGLVTSLTSSGSLTLDLPKAVLHSDSLTADVAPQREDWMTQPIRPERVQEQHDRQDEALPAEPEVVAGLRVMRKHNPEALGGMGASAPGAALAATNTAALASDSRSGMASGRTGAMVGDGGASWRLKALRRAQEQARAEGRNLQEVVGERWGSLADLTQELSTLAAADGRAHLRAAAARRRVGEEATAGPVPHYLQDVRSDSAKMLRPSEDASLSWKRDRRDRDRGRGDERSRPRDGDQGANRPNGQGGARGTAGGRDDHRRSEHGREQEQRAGNGGHGREPEREEQRPDRDREQEHDRSRSYDRGRDRRDDRDRDREGDRSERERGRERGRRDRTGEERERHGEQGRLRPSREQVAALQQLAGSLNSFADDGSFMARFAAMQGEAQAAPAKAEPAFDGAGNRPDRSSDEGIRIKLEPGAGLSDAGAADGDELSVPRVGGTGTGPGSSGGGGETGGAGNRAIAAMLRAKAGGGAAAASAAAVAAGEVGAEPHRRAPLFVGDAGAGAGPSGQARPSAAAPAPSAPVAANKSAAELLRARLKGLPQPPALQQQQQQPATGAAREGAADGGGAATEGTRRGVVREEEEKDAGGAAAGSAAAGAGPRREVVPLPLVDERGRAVRGAFGREAAGAGADPGAGRRAGTKAPQRYNRQTGEKERYFADDDKVDLQTMLRRAKYGDDDMDMDEHLAANIAKKRKFRGTDLDVDAEYDYDGGLELYESRSKRGGAEAQRNRDRSRQVTELRRQQRAEAGCALCLNNPSRPPHLTISLGTCTQLLLPPRGRLLRGHCCIAPAEHVASIRGLDEAAWTEVKNFIKCLIRMYGAQGQSVLFMETYMMRGGARNHAVLDAVPVSERQLEKARGYFKKAILEAESEWSTHHAKACIETSAQKGLRESIPPNFPYFYVQFGYGSGYVHVIDDESKFDPNFGRQVLIGLLDLPPELTHQRQRSEPPATQQQWLREFRSQWEPYDWTKQLE
ncbi:hypothetical protein Agub_g7557 [Astrephomene gubernaculifera]|uniref:CWF19-like protein 2 n=1 Tax=Astrephomene gubernaculifera TaxID=47775 RepID=A0AAD3DQD3_9CHLO|nr:hypothetical protein Agub_g7557 [Astrephomene gubernaculifera]